MESLTLFKLMDAKLAYASQRQSVLAQNIANADTPNYRPLDVAKPDFKKLLSDAGETPRLRALTRTNTGHIAGQDIDGSSGGETDTASSFEVAPDGNGVDIEEQLLKAGQNKTDANIVTNIYAKELALLRLAAGANGR